MTRDLLGLVAALALCGCTTQPDAAKVHALDEAVRKCEAAHLTPLIRIDALNDLFRVHCDTAGGITP